MIVVSRKKNDSIVINDDISVVIMEIRGDKVIVGIEAPPEVSVHRHEMYEAMRRSKRVHAPEPSEKIGEESAGEESAGKRSTGFAVKVSAWRTSCLELSETALSAVRRWWNDLSEAAAPPVHGPERPLLESFERHSEAESERPMSPLHKPRAKEADEVLAQAEKTLVAGSTQGSVDEKRPTKKAGDKKSSKTPATKKSTKAAASKRPPGKSTAKKVAKVSRRKTAATASVDRNGASAAKAVKKSSTKSTPKKEAASRRRTPK